jgi:hypothetical protein
MGKSILPIVAPMVESASRIVLAFQQWGEAQSWFGETRYGCDVVGGAVLTVLGGLALAGGMLQLGMAGIIGWRLRGDLGRRQA